MKFWAKIRSFFRKKSKIPDQKFMKIGEFQFQNLMMARVPCLILDLRIEEADKPRIPRSQKVLLIHVLEFVKQNTQSSEHPIVLISDDGKDAFIAADKLSSNKFFNVVVLEGGIRALSEKAKIQIQI